VKTTSKTETRVAPLVTIILPSFNEEAILRNNVEILCRYLQNLSTRYQWEILIINDGSRDRTGEIANELSKRYSFIRVFHHKKNRNLGGAMRTGFKNSRGEYVIVLDIDLSYSPEHIEQMLDEIEETDADIVIASPYMKGGKNTAVPFLRLLLSKAVNRIMRISSDLDIYTFTSMARVYKGNFIRNLNLKAISYDINPEIIQKANILRKRIVEIPAHLDWSAQKAVGKTRTSSLRIFSGILSSLVASFIFRPYMFFMAVGLFVLLLAIYVIAWIFINTYLAFPVVASQATGLESQLTLAVAQVFKERPYSFFVGGTTLIIAIQMLSLGFISLQSKRYFDELFHSNTSIFRTIKNHQDRET